MNNQDQEMQDKMETMENNSSVDFVACIVVKRHEMEMLASILDSKGYISTMTVNTMEKKANNAVSNSLEMSVSTLESLVCNLDSMDYSLALSM